MYHKWREEGISMICDVLGDGKLSRLRETHIIFSLTLWLLSTHKVGILLSMALHTYTNFAREDLVRKGIILFYNLLHSKSTFFKTAPYVGGKWNSGYLIQTNNGRKLLITITCFQSVLPIGKKLKRYTLDGIWHLIDCKILGIRIQSMLEGMWSGGYPYSYGLVLPQSF